MARFVMATASAAALLSSSLLTAAPAHAYGRADNPVAQVEISGNCESNNYCSSTFGGTGGFWIWAELDASSLGATSGSVDATLSGCGHNVGGPRGGGGGGPATGSWQEVPFAQMLSDAQQPNGVFPVAIAFDSTGNPDSTMNYYEISFSDPFLPVLAVPVQDGHYNVSGLQLLFGTAPGVSFQTTVAP